MTDKKATLLKLNENLNILQEREAKYGGNAPLDLLNQIDDHKQAIDLTRQVITGEISEQEWKEALESLLLAINNGQVVNIKAEIYVAGDAKGDVFAGDKVSGNKILGDKITIYETPSLPPAEARTRTNLGILLKNVETTWVKGVLEKSVYGATLLDLGIEIRTDAVDHPWQMVLEEPGQSREVLPPETKIKDIFNQTNRLLLILGEPGSGKTTTLLQLAHDLIAEVDSAFSHPVPVILNLSIWTNIQQSLDDWLVSELSSKYRVPKKQGRQWLEERRILPLLDGLDEVKLENRVACVENINQLAVDYGLQGMVVCSRIKDYVDLDVRLEFYGAIYLQPLTSQQLDEYFERAGAKLTSLRTVLQQDETLYSMAQSPLMLNIMSLAYQGASVEDLSNRDLDTNEARRNHLFNTYITRMFKRKGKRRSYDDERTIKRLVWLAQNMQQHNQDMFLIEGLQPGWLLAGHWRWVYILVSRLIEGLGVGLSLGLGVGLSTWLWSSDGLSIGLSFGLRFGLSSGLGVGIPIGIIDLLRFEWLGMQKEVRPRSHFWRLVINIVAIGLIVGLTFGLIFGLRYGLFYGGLLDGLRYGLIGGLGAGLIFGLRGSQQSLTNDIQTVESLHWSWHRSLIGGLIGIPMGGVVIVPINEPIIKGLISGLIIGMILNGLSRAIIETKAFPNQGVRLSVQNAIFGGLISGLSFGLVFTLFDTLVVGLGVGTFVGLLGGLWYGGLDVIQHYTLRLILIIQGHIPRNYANFLDYAVERVFLQKVGGGYRFIHRLLLEHFAQVHIEGKLNDFQN